MEAPTLASFLHARAHVGPGWIVELTTPPYFTPPPGSSGYTKEYYILLAMYLPNAGTGNLTWVWPCVGKDGLSMLCSSIVTTKASPPRLASHYLVPLVTTFGDRLRVVRNIHTGEVL